MSDCIHTPPGIKPCPYCEIERLRRELAEARNRQSCDNGQPWICHALATARSELAEARGLLKSTRFAVAIAITYSIKAEAKEHYRKLLTDIDALLPAADQPDAVKPCADCGEPTDVWHDGSHTCWKCRA